LTRVSHPSTSFAVSRNLQRAGLHGRNLWNPSPTRSQENTMKKMSRVLAVAAVSTLAALTGAADCLGSGSSVVECATADDCAGELENTACDTSSDPGLCVAPTCAETVDCQLSDTSEDSPITESGGDGCGDGEVEFQGFVEGETYCGISPEPGVFECEEINAVQVGATGVDGGTLTVCAIEASTCIEGVCGAAE
jgi:hypothetical protein